MLSILPAIARKKSDQQVTDQQRKCASDIRAYYVAWTWNEIRHSTLLATHKLKWLTVIDLKISPEPRNTLFRQLVYLQFIQWHFNVGSCCHLLVLLQNVLPIGSSQWLHPNNQDSNLSSSYLKNWGDWINLSLGGRQYECSIDLEW